MYDHGMMGAGIFGTLIIGALAGWIAEKLTKSNMSLLMNIIVGVIGSYLGFFLAGMLGIRLGMMFQGWFFGHLIVATAGAVLLITLVRALRR